MTTDELRALALELAGALRHDMTRVESITIEIHERDDVELLGDYLAENVSAHRFTYRERP